MGFKMLLFLLFGLTNAIEVHITEIWKKELGWEVTCSWTIPSNDKLQSVRLYKNGQQFMIYRPETQGPERNEFFRAPEYLMMVNCIQDNIRGEKCVMEIEPYQPPTGDITFSCEVSGEGPEFQIKQADHVIHAFMTPSDAVLDVKIQREQSPARVTLNCSSEGLPAPNLLWTIADQQVPAAFTNRQWNATTKLWHVWSSLSPQSEESQKMTCTPQVLNNENQLVRGKAAEYTWANNASKRRLDIFLLTVPVLLILLR